MLRSERGVAGTTTSREASRVDLNLQLTIAHRTMSVGRFKHLDLLDDSDLRRVPDTRP